MRLRIAATVLLMLQLQPLAWSALCLDPGTAPVACHEMTPHHLMANGPGVQAQPHCADMGMCSLPSAGVPASAAASIESLSQSDRSPAVPPMHAGDPVAPPAPPPQA